MAAQKISDAKQARAARKQATSGLSPEKPTVSIYPVAAKSTSLFRWITDLHLLITSPSRFYRRRAEEQSALPGAMFVIGYTFLVTFIPLCWITAKIGSHYAPWRLLVYVPVFWIIAIAVRALIIGGIVVAKRATPFATAFQQAFAVDAFSWITFFTFWMVANIWMFGSDHSTTGTTAEIITPFIVVGVIGVVCRIHGYILDLLGLSEISGLSRLASGALMLVADGVSTVAIFIAFFIMVAILYR